MCIICLRAGAQKICLLKSLYPSLASFLFIFTVMSFDSSVSALPSHGT